MLVCLAGDLTPVDKGNGQRWDGLGAGVMDDLDRGALLLRPLTKIKCSHEECVRSFELEQRPSATEGLCGKPCYRHWARLWKLMAAEGEMTLGLPGCPCLASLSHNPHLL